MTMCDECRGKRFAVIKFVNAGEGVNARRPAFFRAELPGNLGTTPVEMMESLAPIQVLLREIGRGSGGS
ncbi:hypothetical protein GCM10009097_34690 [Pigmentiphaga daeguensis]|uniref:Antitoxin Xre/MbcA/ParS-like toxin-binding domain-containing protein n=1 Tax=Pigmentiphaga daeguensis TaxID=414049 RepID=A0ABP3M6Y5_9BURK